MNRTHNWICVDKETRIMRIILSAIVSFLMIFSPVAPFGIHTYAAGSSINFDDYMLLVAYFEAGNSVTKSGSTYTIANDFTLAGISDTTTSKDLDSSDDHLADIQSLAEAKASNQIESSLYPNAYKLAGTASIIAGNNIGELKSYIDSIYKAAGGNITVDLRTGSYHATNSAYDKKLKTAVTDFNASMASSTATGVFESIYGADNWNPDTGLATEVMATIYSVVNVIFTVVAQLIMWFFIAQTAFDLFYISFEPIRPFIGPVGSGSGAGLGGNNGNGNLLSKLHIPICSHAAEEVVSGGGSGSLGGNGAGVNSSSAALRYLWKRAPLLISIAIYFILAVMGYWTKIIGWVAEIVIKVANFILSIGG